MYHCHPPTQIIKTEAQFSVAPEIAEEKMLKHRSFDGFQINPVKDYLQSRIPVLVNNDCHIVLAAPQESMADYFYKNADADELIFVHEGERCFKNLYGEISFGYGDYLVIPRGTIYQIEFSTDRNRLFIVESFSPIRFPKRYQSRYGQLLEHVPFCERDLRPPSNLETYDEQGDFLIRVKKKGMLYGLHYGHIHLMWWAGMDVVIRLLFQHS